MGRQYLRSVLAIDFDNVYIGLKALDEGAAEAFATDPDRWISWLEHKLRDDDATDRQRRFLIKSVYLNPLFKDYRSLYTRSGFRAIDCPALTGKGKNGADIHMVLDLMDTLQSPVRYDEYIIISSDADFTPVLQRLRAHDKRTVVVSAGLTSAAFRSVCDQFISPEDLVTALTRRPVSTQDDLEVPAEPPVDIAAPAVDAATDGAAEMVPVAAVLAAIRDAVATAGGPIPASRAGQLALSVDPTLKRSDWRSTGSFRSFLGIHAKDLAYIGPPPGFVYDVERHSLADIPSNPQIEALGEVVRKVCYVSGAPQISTESYRAVFGAIATDIATHAFSLTDTSKRVRDAVDAAGFNVGRNYINFILKGLVFNKALEQGSTVGQLAESTFANIVQLSVGAGLELSDADISTIHDWICATDPAAVDGAAPV